MSKRVKVCQQLLYYTYLFTFANFSQSALRRTNEMSTRSTLVILVFYTYIFGCSTQNAREITNTTNVTVEEIRTNDGNTVSITTTVEETHIGDTIGEKILNNKFKNTLRNYRGSKEQTSSGSTYVQTGNFDQGIYRNNRSVNERVSIGSTQTDLRSSGLEETYTHMDSAVPILSTKAVHRTIEAETGRCVANSDSIQTLTLPNWPSFNVRCINDAWGKCSWAVILERKSQRDNFDFAWQNYRTGFGDPTIGNGYFVGLQNLYALTQYQMQELYISKRFEGEDLVKEIYANFRIGDESVDYAVLSLSVVTNNTMIRHLQIASKFSTKDRQFDKRLAACARTLGIGWWYSEKCLQSTMLRSVRAYVKAPTIIAVRPNNCESKAF
nr:tenascin-R-like isoform X1 [Bactrocera oleae]